MNVTEESGWKEIGLEAALLHTGNNATADAIAEWIAKNPKRLRKLTPSMVEMFCYFLAVDSRHRMSRAVRRRPLGVCEKGKETTPKRDVQASGRAHKNLSWSRWLDGFEVGGKKLRNTTRTDLLDYAEHQKNSGRGNFAVAYFALMIAEQMDGTRRQVGNTPIGKWKDEQFDSVYEECRKRAEGLDGGGELSLAGS